MPASATRVLSVGYDRHLMASRSMVLHSHGYAVVEAYSVDEAIRLLESSSIHALLLCHTLTPEERQRIVLRAKSRKPVLPVVCVSAAHFRLPSDGCIVVDSDPPSVIAGLRSALNGRSQAPQSD